MKKLYFLCLFVLISSLSFGQIWTEEFDTYAPDTGIEGDGAGGITNLGDFPASVTKWTLDATNSGIFNASDWTKVIANELSFRDTDGTGGVVWESQLIDISAATSAVTFQLLASNNDGGFEPSDLYNVSYSVDGGPFTLIADWNGLGDANNTILGEKNGMDWASEEIITQSGLSGNTLQIRVQVLVNAGAEQFFLDDISVFEGAAPPNISVSGMLADFNYQLGNGPSAEESFSVSATDLGTDLSITAPAGYELSLTSGAGFMNALTITPDPSGNIASTAIFVRLAAGLPLGTYTGDITLTSTGAEDRTVSASGEVGVVTNECFDLSTGTELFELVTVVTNSDMDTWTLNAGTYNMNGFCGGGCQENVDSWLIFGPLDMTGVSNLALEFDAVENFGNTDLLVQFTSAYSGCPDGTAWTLAGTVTEMDAGAVSVDLSAATGTDVFIGIQYVDDGADGYSDWDLSNVELVSTNTCPTLGMRPTSTCAVCDVTLQSEVYVCTSNTAGDNNDGVTIEIPYTGVENSITSITTTSGGTIGGDDPATTADGTITITGLSEGSAWDLTINGGDCNGTTVSGNVAADQCDPEIVVINEINADPSNNANNEGDANGDGTADFNDDEFVEIYNTGATAINMENYTLEDATQVRHTFPAGTTLAPNTFITVFGGGTPTGISGLVQVSSTGSLGLNNGGDTVTLKDNNGVTVVAVTYTGAGNNQSIGRSPDFTGNFVQHSTIAGNNGALYSPNSVNNNPVLSTAQFNSTSFTVFPNPTNTGRVTINATQNGPVNVRVFDILGKEVKNEILTANILDVSGLSNGVYLLKISQNSATITKKLVIN